MTKYSAFIIAFMVTLIIGGLIGTYTRPPVLYVLAILNGIAGSKLYRHLKSK